MYMDKNKLDLTVVMPALNEENNIVPAINATLKAFDDLKINGEITVINDGSSDKTEGLVRGVMQKDSRVRIVNHDTPKGIGASFWDGVVAAGGGSVVSVVRVGGGTPSGVAAPNKQARASRGVTSR